MFAASKFEWCRSFGAVGLYAWLKNWRKDFARQRADLGRFSILYSKTAWASQNSGRYSGSGRCWIRRTWRFRTMHSRRAPLIETARGIIAHWKNVR